jgi:hypothetical protein
MATKGRLTVNSLNFLNAGVDFLTLSAGSDGVATFSSNSGNVKIGGISDPSSDQDIATKKYVDSIATAGASWKNSVVAATTVEGTLETSFADGEIIDGVTLVTGERILIKDQTTTPSENGIYIVESSGAPTRASDLPTDNYAAGSAVWVAEGTANSDKGFICTTDHGDAPFDDLVGTDDLSFTNFSSAPAVSGADTQVQFNNGGSFGSSADFTWDGTSLQLGDSKNLTVGAGDDLVLIHDGTDSSITNITGNLNIVNSDTAGTTTIKLGTATNATLFSVTDSVDGSLFDIDGSGIIKVPDGSEIRFGTGSDFRISHVANNTLFNNVNPTGDTIFRIAGSNGTGNTKYLFQNNSAHTMMTYDNQDIVNFNLNGETYQGSFAINASDDSHTTLTPMFSADILSSTTSLITVETGADMLFVDNAELRIGTSTELKLLHDGANSSITSTTGDLNIVNSNAAGDTVFKMGDDAAGTNVIFTDSSDASVMTITSDRTVDSTSVSTGAVQIVGGLGVTLDITCNEISTMSDATLKTNIIPLNNSLDKLNKIEGYSYEWVKDAGMGETRWGVLAQQLEEIGLGDLVTDGAEHKSVNYMMMIPLVIEALKELKTSTDSRLNNLETL